MLSEQTTRHIPTRVESGTFVKPGRSTRVKFRTWGEYIFRFIGCLLIPLLLPATRDVSLSISLLTSLKSVNFRFGMWWNSAHSDRRAALGDR